MKKAIALLLFMFVSFVTLAQNFPYGKVSDQEIQLKKYLKDTSAHAVVLNEFGDCRINVTNNDEVRLIYQYHVKIKLFDNKGLEQGNIQIPFYHRDGQVYEEVTDIQGSTTYIDDKGAVNTVELDRKKVFTVNENKHWDNAKFALPGLRNGCVIEYKYTIVSPYVDQFHNWEFQSDIPKIYSSFNAHIPAFWDYHAAMRGSLKLSKNSADLESECFSFHGAKSDCSNLFFAMNDIPAFVEEDYMTSRKNFLAAIYFELSDYTNLQTGSKIKVAQEWRDLDYTLKTENAFGSQLKRTGLFKDRLTPVLAGKTDSLSKAKAIFAYLQKWYKWNNFIGIYSVDGVKNALETHSGSIGDINLGLVAALNSAGLNAEAVLLSTRDHGMINMLYPNLGDFDYVIAKVNIGNQSYLLDATDPLLPFGILPLKCLNDKGRVFSLNKPSYWIDLSNTGQKQSSTYTLDLTLKENGKLAGTITKFSMGYDAYLKRKQIKKYSSTDEYVDNLNEKMPRMKILKSDINNVDSLDLPIQEIYDIEIDGFDNMNRDRIAFNPFLLRKINTNPFKMAERDYPVDWGMPSTERFIINVHLPDQYVVETIPQNVAFGMPNKGGSFVTNVESSGNMFALSHVTSFKKSIYGPDEYPYLKELYNKIIQSEKAEIIIKKK